MHIEETFDDCKLSPREAYESYLRIWHKEHWDGHPMSFDEFVETEYCDSDYMRYLTERME